MSETTTIPSLCITFEWISANECDYRQFVFPLFCLFDFFLFCWAITDLLHCLNLRCLFATCIYCNIIITIELVTIFITSHNISFSVVRILKIQFGYLTPYSCYLTDHYVSLASFCQSLHHHHRATLPSFTLL